MRIVIVGGGTAGWMAASYVRKALKNVENVTVVQSANIPKIGVGEATFSTLKIFFDYLGLRESEWMTETNASYKLAIRFQNWTKKKGHFYHPFERLEVVDGFNLADWYLKLNDGRQFDQACFVTTALCEHNRSPRFLDGKIYDDKVARYFVDGSVANTVIRDHSVQYPYGYHFDAHLLAEFLQKLAKNMGVNEVIDDVKEVVLNESGLISHLVTGQGKIEGDIFIDCTGFRGLLINQTMKEPFLEFATTLPNDSAVAIQVPRDPGAEIRPYTSATAMNAGWVWTIPLYNRDGSGYVYCSQYISKDEAEAEFRKFLGPNAKRCNANHIKMRIGRNRNSWVKNCVAIGLASGFVEPLESTGIFFIQNAIEEFVHHFPGDKLIDEGQQLSFNRIVNDCFDGVCEFLSLHFLASDRDDTKYWRDAKERRKSEALQERLKIWQARLPSMGNIYQPYHGFEAYSYSVMLQGLNFRPGSHLASLDHLDERKARSIFQLINSKSSRLVKTLPSVKEYLDSLRGESAEWVTEKKAA